MTFILDMASGREYPGEDLSSPKQGAAKLDPATDCEYPQLQLAVVETTGHNEKPDNIFAGIDIDTLIENVED